jgi:glutathione S-transferase
LVYLDEKFPNPPLFGKTAEEKARMWCRVMEMENYFGPALSKVSRPLLFNHLPEKEAEVHEGKAHMHEELARVEDLLSKHAFIGGDRIGAADLVAFPLLMALLRGANKPIAANLDLGLLPLQTKYPHIAKWKSAIEAMDGYEATYPPHWREG